MKTLRYFQYLKHITAVTRIPILCLFTLTLLACGGEALETTSSDQDDTPVATDQDFDESSVSSDDSDQGSDDSDQSSDDFNQGSDDLEQNSESSQLGSTDFVYFATEECVEVAESDGSTPICEPFETPDPDSFEIVSRYPEDKFNKVPVTTTFEIAFGQPISQGIAELPAYISVINTKDSSLITGELGFSDEKTITFNPAEDLEFQTVYKIEINPGLLSTKGENFEGESWSFATLFDVGPTTRETIEECGRSSSLRYLGRINLERKLESTGACSQYNYATAQPPLALQCDLQLIAVQAIVNTASMGQGFADANGNFDYAGAFDFFGYKTSVFGTFSAIETGEARTEAQLFEDGMTLGECDVFMSPTFTEFGGRNGRTSLMSPPETTTIHEMILAKPTK